MKWNEANNTPALHPLCRLLYHAMQLCWGFALYIFVGYDGYKTLMHKIFCTMRINTFTLHDCRLMMNKGKAAEQAQMLSSMHTPFIAQWLFNRHSRCTWSLLYKQGHTSKVDSEKTLSCLGWDSHLWLLGFWASALQTELLRWLSWLCCKFILGKTNATSRWTGKSICNFSYYYGVGHRNYTTNAPNP